MKNVNLKKVKNKIEKFKYKLVHIITYPVKSIKTLHENLMQYNMLETYANESINPYQMFFGWLLDVAVNGVLIAIMFMLITKKPIQSMLRWTLVFGLMRYLVIDFTKDFRQAIK